MNKIIQINLAGQAVSIDEIAYQSLANYLRSLQNHFATTQDGDEILADIESRIAELFFSKIKKGNTFINTIDVSEAVSLMGTVEDIDIADEESEQAGTHKALPLGKKLFRDSEDRLLGGVCSGLAAYFNIDTSLARLGMILLMLFTGVPLLAYFILWAVLPATITLEDRTRMRGGNTTVNDIVNNVRRGASDVADSVKNEASIMAKKLKKNDKFWRTRKTVSTGLEQIIRFIAKILGAGILIVLVIVGIVVTIFILATAAGRFTAYFDSTGTSPILSIFSLNWMFSITLLSLILLPLGALCYTIILFIFNKHLRLNIKMLFIAWVLSLVIFFGVSMYAASDISIKSFKNFGDQLLERSVFEEVFFIKNQQNLKYNADTLHRDSGSLYV